MTEFDYKKLRTGGAALISGQALQALVAFATNLVLVRYILPDGFGRFALVLAGASLFLSLVSLRVNILITRLGEREYTEDIKDLYFSALSMETAVAFVIILAWLIITGTAGLWEILLVLSLGFRHWVEQNRAFFERTMPYRKLAIVETIVAIAAHAAAVVSVVGGIGWVALYIREIILTILSFTAMWWIGGITLRRFRFLTIGEWKALIREARGVWLDSVLEGSFHRLTILLAGFMGSDLVAGLIFQALRLAVVPHQFLAPIVTRLVVNWFGRAEEQTLQDQGRDKVLLVLFPPLIVIALLAIAFADPVVPFLFGENWTGVIDLFRAMAGIVVFISTFEVLRSYCLSVRRTGVLLAGRAFQYAGMALPLAIALNGWLEGALALALGLSFAYALAFVSMLVILKIRF